MTRDKRIFFFLFFLSLLLLGTCCKKSDNTDKGSHQSPKLPILSAVFVDCQNSLKATPNEKCLYYSFRQDDFNQVTKPITMYISLSFQDNVVSEKTFTEISSKNSFYSSIKVNIKKIKEVSLTYYVSNNFGQSNHNTMIIMSPSLDIPTLTKSNFVCDDFSQSPRCVIDLEWSESYAKPLKLLVRESHDLSESFDIPNGSLRFRTGKGGAKNIMRLKSKPLSYSLESSEEKGYSYLPRLDSSLLGQGVYVYPKSPNEFSQNLSQAIPDYSIRYIYLSMGEFDPTNKTNPISYDKSLTRETLEKWQSNYEDEPLRLVPFIDSQTRFLSDLSEEGLRDYAYKIGTLIAEDPSVSGVGFDYEGAQNKTRHNLRLFFNYLANALFDYANTNHQTQKILFMNPSFTTFFNPRENQSSPEVKNWTNFLTGSTCKRNGKNYCLAINMAYDLTDSMQSYEDYVHSFCSGNSAAPMSHLSFFTKNDIAFQYALPLSASDTTSVCNAVNKDPFVNKLSDNVYAQDYSKAQNNKLLQSDFVISALNFFSCYLNLCQDESNPPVFWMSHSFSNNIAPEWLDENCRLETQGKDKNYYTQDYLDKFKRSFRGFVFYRLSDLNDVKNKNYPKSLDDTTCNDPNLFEDKLKNFWSWVKNQIDL